MTMLHPPTHHPRATDRRHGDGLLGCTGLSIEHVDGSTECAEGPGCSLPHELHHFVMGCTELDPPCPCSPEDAFAPAAPLAA